MSLFIPSSRLLIPAGDSQNSNGQKLVLASSEWFDLQNQVQALLALPSSFSEYEARYGEATAVLQMKECFTAMQNLQTTASKYGSAKSLRANILKDPNFLANSDRPVNNAYSATVWTLEKAHQNAFALASALRSIPTSARGEQPSDVVEGIKSLFLDNNQIVDKMRQIVAQLDVLIQEFQAIQAELDQAQAVMKTYTESSSKTRESLNKEIGNLQDKIAQLEKDRDAAYEQWLALTISASIVPVIMVITGIAAVVLLLTPGTAPFAVGMAASTFAAGAAGTGLAVAATAARNSYNDLIKEISTQKESLKKKTAYSHDLGALDNLMKFSLPNSSAIITQIRVFREAWANSLDEIRYKVANLNTDNLASGPWLKEQEMAASAANWIKVDDSLKAFINGSFVDSNLIAFGSPLPKDDPDWQKKLALKLAA